jgi:phage FluMu gp28-like protein
MWRGTDAEVIGQEFLSRAEEYRASIKVEAPVVRDVASFFREVCKLEPYAYQMQFADVYRQSRYLALRWPRQTGKSTFIAGLLTQDAYENKNLHVGFIGPSWRQTKMNIKKVTDFCRNLPEGSCCVQKTRIYFSSGSVIEAFPNNPETIRGSTFHRLWWDETNFTANDQELYTAILFTLATKENAKFIASSTPFNTDSLFWKMCNHKRFAKYVQHHFSWEEALAPKGPLNPTIVDEIREQFGDDPGRWRREMEAEWAEDEDTWLAESLIVSCVGTVKNCGEDLQEFKKENEYTGDFFVGLDLAQTRDYCVLAVVERLNDELFLRHLKIFQQPTLYATVLGYLKMLQDRWGGFEKIRVDFTREGPSIIKDMEVAGINNAEGVNFSVPRKSEMASLLKQRMSSQKLFYPLLNWERPYRGDICTELNVERFELRKDGNIGYSHPSGTHDDVFWAIALACYSTVEMEPEPVFLGSIPR